MKNIKLILSILILVNSAVTHSQDINSKDSDEALQKITSKKLYLELNEIDKNPIVVINGFIFENSMAVLNQIFTKSKKT